MKSVQKIHQETAEVLGGALTKAAEHALKPHMNQLDDAMAILQEEVARQLDEQTEARKADALALRKTLDQISHRIEQVGKQLETEAELRETLSGQLASFRRSRWLLLSVLTASVAAALTSMASLVLAR